MPPRSASAPDIDDPALDGTDWLFEQSGQVYGPVEGRRLAGLLYAGEVNAETRVSSGDGAWRRLEEVGPFLLHVRKAEAAQRVEQDVTGNRLLKARRARNRWVGVAVAGVLVVLGAAGLAALLSRGQVERSPLLEGFGQGITLVTPARVAVARPAAEDEIAVTMTPAERAARPGVARSAAAPVPGARQAGAVEGGDLVESRFDAGRIQAVVAARQRSLGHCLQEHAARDPGYQGEVPLEFTVGNEGRVVRVAVTDPRLRQGPLRDCFEKELSAWPFDAFPGQRPTVSLVFRVGGP